MNILIAADTYYPHISGASYFAQRLAAALSTRGHNVAVICPSRTYGNETYTRQGVTIHGLASVPAVFYKNFRISFWPSQARIRRIVAEFKPDVIHIQSHFYICHAVLSVAKDNNIPLMATNHFMPENLTHYLHLPATWEKKIQDWGWQELRKNYGQADIVTTPTQTAANLINQRDFSKPVYPLSCGINRQKFHSGYATGYLTKRYRIPAKPVMLYVGRLDREKNLADILHALALVDATKRPHFLIAGKGAEEKHLRTLAKELNIDRDVTFTGFVPDEDLPALYCLADFFIMGGTAELQSLVTMEAMSSGLPVIAANAIALPELVHHGDNGYLFTADNNQELADDITKMMSDSALRKMMGQKSLEIIAKHDSLTVLQDYEAKYQEAIRLHAVAQANPGK